MYRYCVDNAVTYTSEDFVLFRGSPFACWMERLTIENPDHAIPPDAHSSPPVNPVTRQDDLADTLRSEGKNVVLVDWDRDEPTRRTRTLEAMRAGVDYIVNAQLALGSLSESANLLMRTSGYSELGSYLYVPCDTQAKTILNSVFRLCFLADLLHSLQGQMPPQMLIIRGDADVVPLHTEDHIYHYQAVKQRCMDTMRSFRKHRLPDPAESSHFGRWSDCANEVLKQRALRQQQSEAFDSPIPQQAVAGDGLGFAQPRSAISGCSPSLLAESTQIVGGSEVNIIVGGKTLAEQARMLPPSTNTSSRSFFRRGSTVEILLSEGEVMAKPAERQAGVTPQPSVNAESTDTTLQDLEFIGRKRRVTDSPDTVGPDASVTPSTPFPVAVPQAQPTSPLQNESQQNYQAHDAISHAEVPRPTLKPHPLDSIGFSVEVADSLVDMDIVNSNSPPAALSTNGSRFGFDSIDDSDYQLPLGATTSAENIAANKDKAGPAVRPFASTLMTGGPLGE